MTKEQIKLKVLHVQLHAQLMLEELEELHGIDPIWRQDGKAAGNNAIKACETFVKRIGDKVSAEQTDEYSNACKILRTNMSELLKNVKA